MKLFLLSHFLRDSRPPQRKVPLECGGTTPRCFGVPACRDRPNGKLGHVPTLQILRATAFFFAASIPLSISASHVGQWNPDDFRFPYSWSNRSDGPGWSWYVEPRNWSDDALTRTEPPYSLRQVIEDGEIPDYLIFDNPGFDAQIHYGVLLQRDEAFETIEIRGGPWDFNLNGYKFHGIETDRAHPDVYIGYDGYPGSIQRARRTDVTYRGVEGAQWNGDNASSVRSRDIHVSTALSDRHDPGWATLTLTEGVKWRTRNLEVGGIKRSDGSLLGTAELTIEKGSALLVGGTLTVFENGKLDLEHDGSLGFRVFGESNYGNLTVEGEVNLNGTIDVVFENVPSTAAWYRLVDGEFEFESEPEVNVHGLDPTKWDWSLHNGDLLARPIPKVSETDRRALVRLYEETDGDNWENNEGWLDPDIPAAQWAGVVRVSGDGKVEWLSLGHNNLAGEIPDRLGDLSGLQRLYLSGNNLAGEIPDTLYSLSDLNYLALERNNLKGEISPAIANLRKLRYLNLLGNLFSGEIPKEIGTLENLRHLDLAWNRFDGEIPSEFENLLALEFLGLTENNLTGEIPDGIYALSNLERLFLGGNNLSGEISPEIGNLRNLTHLGLSDNQFEGSIPFDLGNLSGLQWLYLWGNELTGEIPGTIYDLSDLERLFLGINQLSGEISPEIANLSNLIYLDLAENEILGEVPVEIGMLTNLEFLYIFGNPLVGALPDSLVTLNLTGFYFDNTLLCEPIESDFRNWLDAIPNSQGTEVRCRELFSFYDEWAAANFIDSERSDENISGPSATPASDNVANLIKFALGLGPMESAHDDIPRPAIVEENGQRYPAIEFTRDPEADVELVLKATPDLNAWDPIPFTEETIETLPDDRERIRLVAEEPVEDDSHFLRLEVSLPEE